MGHAGLEPEPGTRGHPGRKALGTWGPWYVGAVHGGQQQAGAALSLGALLRVAGAVGHTYR
eukprot:2348313-Lingulodinium_polyedra.AAC.1